MNLSLKLFGREVLTVGKSASSLAAAFARGDDAGSGSGAQLSSAYQQSTWVYACVSAIAEQIAQIPFRFSRAERVPVKQRHGQWRRRAMGETIVESGTLVELFNRPHPHLNRFQFWELLVSWLQLRGEFFAVPLDAAFGLGATRPTMMGILSPDQFREDVRANMLIGWRYTGSGSQSPAPTMELLPTDVITDRLANPFDFWRGMSPLTVARLAAQSDFASAQFMKGLMLNNADTGVVVTTDQQADEPQREAILSALKERKRKAGTADRPLFLWGGAKLEKPTLSSADMQFLEQRKFNRQEICAVFKVPQEIIGFTEDANRSVGESARLNFIENRIAPLCERLEAALDPFIKSQDKGLWGWFDLEALPIMQAARRARYDSAGKAFVMGVPIDDCSEIFDLGLPDDLPHAGKSFLPFSLQEVGGADAGSQKPEDGSQKPEQNIFERAAKFLRHLSSDIRPPNSHVCGISSEGYAASIKGSVKKKTQNLSSFFVGQRGRVIAALGQVSSQLSVVSSQKSSEDIFNLDSENAKLLARLKPLLLADLDFGGAQLFAEIGASSFAVPPAEALAFLAKRKNEIEGVNRFTFAALKQTLGDGLAAGETINELTERVKSVFKDASDRRAESIALTETNIAVNNGRFEAMKQAKVEKKAWLAANLAGSRATHQQAGRDYADGIPLASAFRVGGEDLMFPGDPVASPGNVINCRCTSIAVKGGKAFHPGSWLSFEAWLTAREGVR